MRAVLLALLCLGCGAAPAPVQEPPRAEAEPPPSEAEPSPMPAADATPRDRAASAMEALFAACRDDRLDDAAEYIAYRGSDRARRWRTTPRMDAPDEALQVRRICADLASLLRAATSHQKVGYESQAESEGVWHAWQVRFDIPSGPRTILMAFLEVDGRFLLGDID